MHCSEDSCVPGLNCSQCDRTGCMNCPSNSYPVLNTFDCQLCGVHCLVCTAVGCQTCDDPAVYEPKPNSLQCRAICSATQYRLDDTCHNCDISCSTCENSTLCLTCNSGYLSNPTPGLCYPDLQCGNGLWNNQGVCTPCDISCQTCVNSTSCLACKPGYDVQAANQLCLLSCMESQYRDGNTRMCVECPEKCASCSNSDFCLRCQEGYYPGTAAGTCFVCDSTCFTCENEPTNCLICNVNFLQIGSLPGKCTGSCDISCNGCSVSYNNCFSCNQGYFASGSPGECLRCSTECGTCESEQQRCLSCAAGYFPLTLFPGICTNACDSSCSSCQFSPQQCTQCSFGFYSPSLPSACMSCHLSCLTCLSSATNCLLCAESYLPVTSLPGVCQSCDLSCLTCEGSVSTCVETASGYYFTGRKPGPAAPCELSCTECEGSATHCSVCASFYFPALSLPGVCTRTCDLSCLSCSISAVVCDQCQVGYYHSASLPTSCLKCDSSCSTCSNSPTYCGICTQGYIPIESLPGGCTQECDLSCENCSTSSKICITCSHNYLPITKLPGVCSSSCAAPCQSCQENVSTCLTCAEGYVILTSLPGTCTKTCDVSCQDCSVSSVNCSACAEGYFPFALTSKKCVPQGSCSPSCQDSDSCPLAYTSCSSCAPGFSLQSGICVTQDCFPGCSSCLGSDYNDCVACIATYTYLPDLGICQAPTCSQSCATCFGLGADQCLTCKPNAVKSAGTDLCVCAMFYTYVASTGICVYSGDCSSSCLTCSGPYENNCLSCPTNSLLTVDSICECAANYTWQSSVCTYSGPCDSTCLSCSGPAASQCLTCSSHSYLSGSACRCEASYAWSLGKCAYLGPCEGTCRTCEGALATQCVSCRDALALFSSGTCSCPSNFTWNANSQVCAYSGPCPEPYSVCSSASKGTTCDPNANPTCTACKTGYDWVQSLNRCTVLVCDAVCSQCYGRLSTNCLACNTAANHSLTASNTCACKEGYYGQVTAQTSLCIACHLTCRTCSDAGANFCLTCPDNTTRTQSKTCQPNTGYYWNNQQSLFAKCSDNCLACSGSASECTACPATFILVTSTCQCVAGTLLDAATNACKACDPACVTCFGFSSGQCLSCARDQNLQGSVCQCKAENMYNNKGACSSCYDGCKACTGPESNQCISCYSPAILSSKAPASCFCVNPLKPAPTPKVCQVCPDTCGDCIISDSSKCTSCKANAHLASDSPSSCVCNDSFYLNTNTRVCASCHQSCATCSSPKAAFCTTCNGVAVLESLYCAAECPNGYTANGGICTLTNNAVYQQPFNTLLTPVVDLISQYKSTYTGNPKTLYNQGLQLTGNQQVLLPPNPADSRELTLAPSFSIEAWIRPSTAVDSGNKEYYLLSKTIAGGNQLLGLSILQNAFYLRVLAYPPTATIASSKSLYQSSDAKTVTLSGGKVPSAQTWSLLRATVATSVKAGVPSLVLTVYIDGVQVGTKTEVGYFFRDFSSANGEVKFVVGAMNQSGSNANYEGALAELTINAGIQTTTPASCSCSKCTASGLCLIPCLSTQYLANSQCATCPNQCLASGCLQPNDCTMSVDSLCATSSDFTVCTACKSLAELKSAKCNCVANAVYDSVTTSCSCSSGFKQSNNECVACLNYYQPSELTLTMNLGYSGFTLSFARLMKIDNLRTCSDMFTADSVARFGSSPRCITLENQKIVVGFGTDFVLEDTTFYVDYLKVTAIVGKCSYGPVSLPVPVTVVKPQPPTPVLTAPATYSIACSTETSGLVLSARNSKPGVTGSLSYKWVLTTESGTLTASYSQFSASQDQIVLSDSILIPSSLQVLLSVKDKYNTASTSATVTISRQVSLSVTFDCGNSLSLPTIAEQRVLAQVRQSCDESTRNYSYRWSLKAGLVADGTVQSGIAAVLQTSKNAAITLPKSTLPPGSYQLTCTVLDPAGNQGTGVLDVTITSSALVPKCNTDGVPLAPSQPLSVKCGDSYDPDDLKVKPSGQWDCSMSDSNKCVDKEDKLLSYTATGLELSIAGSVLQPSKTYVFALTLSKGARKSDPLRLSFPVTFPEGTEMTIQSGERNSNQRPFKVKISVTVTATLQKDTTVTADDPGRMMAQSTNKELPLTVIIPPQLGGFVNLNIYFIQLTITTLISYAARINSPPTPGVFSVIPAVGVALITDFAFTASGSQDRDGPDYPITNNFGYYTAEGKEKLYCLPTTSNSLTRKLGSSMINLFNKVCDSGDSCDYASAFVSLTKPKKRGLQTSDIPTLFNEYSLDQDAEFSTCVLLAYEFDFTASDWQYIFSRVMQTAAQFDIINDNQLMMEITCLEALISVSSQQTQANLEAVITGLRNITAQYIDGSYEKVFIRQLEALQNYELTSLAEVAKIDSYFNDIESHYISTNFPDQPSVSVSGLLSTNFLQRVTAPNLNSTFINDNSVFRVAFPSSAGAHLHIEADDVLNIWFKIYRLKDFPAGLVSAQLERSGKYGNYTWTDFDSPVLIDMTLLPDPINLTIPIFNSSALAKGAQCITLTETSTIGLECTILNLTDRTVTISTRSISFMTVVPKGVNYVAGDHFPYVPIEDEECDRYYAPVFIIVSLVGAALLLCGVAFLVKRVAKPANESNYAFESENSLCGQSELELPDQRQDSQQPYIVPGERSQEINLEGSSLLQIDVPAERSHGSSRLRGEEPISTFFKINVPSERSSHVQPGTPEQSQVSSNVRIDVPAEYSQASSSLRVDVPPEHSQSSSSFRVDVPAEQSQASSSFRVDVPAEHSLPSDNTPPSNSDASESGQHTVSASSLRIIVPDERSRRSSDIRGLPEEEHSEAPVTSEPSPSPHPRIRPRRQRALKKVAAEEEFPVESLWKEFLAGHYLLGLLLFQRGTNLLLLLTTLLSDLFFLGVFYYFQADSHSQGTESLMGYFFSSYGQEDVFFYIWSFVITFVLSLVLVTLLNPVWARTSKSRALSLTCGRTLCGGLIVLFIILIVLLDLAVCSDYAGRWSVGFLWAALTEVLVIQFVVSASRVALIKCLVRN